MTRSLHFTVAIVVLGCQTSRPLTPALPDPIEDPIIQIETTPCEGTCRQYLLRIGGDGRVSFVGLYNVKQLGPAWDQLTPAALAELIKGFDRIDFFALEDSYSVAIDAPRSIITYRHGERTKTVERGRIEEINRTPLAELEHSINAAARIERWVGFASED